MEHGSGPLECARLPAGGCPSHVSPRNLRKDQLTRPPKGPGLTLLCGRCERTIDRLRGRVASRTRGRVENGKTQAHWRRSLGMGTLFLLYPPSPSLITFFLRRSLVLVFGFADPSSVVVFRCWAKIAKGKPKTLLSLDCAPALRQASVAKSIHKKCRGPSIVGGGCQCAGRVVTCVAHLSVRRDPVCQKDVFLTMTVMLPLAWLLVGCSVAPPSYLQSLAADLNRRACADHKLWPRRWVYP